MYKPLNLAVADDCGWALAGEQSWKNPMDMDSDEDDDTPKEEEEEARPEPEPEPVRTPPPTDIPTAPLKSLSMSRFGLSSSVLRNVLCKCAGNKSGGHGVNATTTYATWE